INDHRWTMGSYVLGVTVPIFDNDGIIQEADISFNGYSASWSLDANPPNGYVDVQSVATHEFGHFFGLQHVLGGENLPDPPTMAPVVDPSGLTRSPNSDDIKAVCFLYPTTSYSCSLVSDCPKIVATDQSGQEYYSGQLTCTSHTCTGYQSVPQGNAQLG